MNVSSLVMAYAVATTLVGASIISDELKPIPIVNENNVLDWNSALPNQVGDWVEKPSPELPVNLTPEGARDGQDYDIIVQRTYSNSKGQVIQVSVGYGREQRQSRKLHRPELCYAAAGYKIAKRRVDLVNVEGEFDVLVTRMLAVNPNRKELVTYWMRVGNQYVRGPWQFRLAILTSALNGTIPDGLLVRVSSSASSTSFTETELAVHDQWISTLFGTIAESNKKWWFASL